MFNIVRVLLFGGIVGKVLAVARELLSAWLFGTGLVASAYRIAQSGFLIPLNGFVSDALSAGFMPRFAQNRVSTFDKAVSLFAGLHAVLLTISSLVALALIVFSKQWVALLAPGFDDAAANLASAMLQIMALSMPAFVLTALYSSAELVRGKGDLAAARASIQSSGLILGTVMAWWRSQPLLIPVGISLSNFALAYRGIMSARADGLRFWPHRAELAVVRTELRFVWLAFRLLIWVPVLMQVHFIIERRVASVVGSEAVVALDYARFITETIAVLTAVPFGIAGLSVMSTMGVEAFMEASRRSLRALIYLGVPISACIGVHAGLIVKCVFTRGAFNAESAAVTSTILAGIAGGLWAQLPGYAGAKFLNARGQNGALLVLVASGVGLNVAVNLLGYRLFGPVTLGVANACNNVVFGVLVLWRVGVLRFLIRDLMGLALATAGYILLWQLVPRALHENLFAAAAIAAIYWGFAIFGIPRHRSAVYEAVALLRTREQA
ncbi:MAG: lipid II flippase MurJ [Pseudomonadota bacterium]